LWFEEEIGSERRGERGVKREKGVRGDRKRGERRGEKIKGVLFFIFYY